MNDWRDTPDELQDVFDRMCAENFRKIWDLCQPSLPIESGEFRRVVIFGTGGSGGEEVLDDWFTMFYLPEEYKFMPWIEKDL